MSRATLPDEQIISVLLTSKSQAAAAETLGISQRQLYDRMQEQSFKALYQATQAGILRNTVQRLTTLQDKALQAFESVLDDPEAGAGNKPRAAESVLKYLQMYSDQLQAKEREAGAETDGIIDFNFLRTTLA